jgi:hypothetical protein
MAVLPKGRLLTCSAFASELFRDARSGWAATLRMSALERLSGKNQTSQGGANSARVIGAAQAGGPLHVCSHPGGPIYLVQFASEV